mmetsp:Transcript_11990/g.33643  ORF Transcript_11990/g.33643 Transcript_11990/m.33643 type:complete len:222 (+) Transcript_11990:282-947(+)
MYSPNVSLSSNLNLPRSTTASTHSRVLSETSALSMSRIVAVAADRAPSRSFSAPFRRLSQAVLSSPWASLYCTRNFIAISTGLLRTLMAFLQSPSCLCAATATWYSGPTSSSMAIGAIGSDVQSAALSPPMVSGTRAPPRGTGVVRPPWNVAESRSNCSAKSAPLSASALQNSMMSVPGGSVTPSGRMPLGSFTGAWPAPDILGCRAARACGIERWRGGGR